MKKILYLSLIGALLPLGVNAAENCGTTESVSEQISQAGDSTTAVAASLAQSCPELAETIISQAIEQNPQLANELVAAIIEVVPAEMVTSVVTAAFKAVPETMRSELVAAAIKARPDTETAQNVVNALGETGLMAPTDILLAAIQGGADPATISEPTAAGIVNAPQPGIENAAQEVIANVPQQAVAPTLALVTTPGSNAAIGAGSGGGGGTASPN
ncbi:hypothetical protein LZU85_10975 [Vibrio sp. IRLE0018]|uniref:hypothetical protein n=1 Tax=Vibrio floridensis TaxID=2908007 RepID=UPI001F391A4F|nr:hypothetical protein [Vibrio floridensis]MCF8779323.1 hypothetical protein [Vibrio floridensis]